MVEGKLQCVQVANALLGEAPVWDAAQGALLWIDGKRPAVFRWTPGVGQTGHWPLTRPVGCIALHQQGSCVVADAGGFAFLDLHSGVLERIGDSPEPHLPHNQFNDGKVDPLGRLWAGSMDVDGRVPTGSLYRLDCDLTLQKMESQFYCLNGLGWSPDNQTMYVTDSTVRTIWAYDFNLSAGTLGTKRVFVSLPSNDGMPDGLAVDSEGYIWSAIWDGWRLIRIAPDGAIASEVRLPVQRPTSCTFGGRDLKTLYITSAADELGWRQLSEGPLAGGLFSLELPVSGLPQGAFKG